MTRHGITIGIYQCWDCNAVRKVEGRELNDLAHAPHCHKCGAPMFQLADPPPSVNRHPALRCPHCRLSFESNRYLGLHLRLRRRRRHRRVVGIGGGLLCPDDGCAEGQQKG